MDKLFGRLSDIASLKGKLSDNFSLRGFLTIPQFAGGEIYEGPYDVTPRLNEQTLATKHKAMADDVTVYEIPITYTSNPYDGKTVLIG